MLIGGAGLGAVFLSLVCNEEWRYFGSVNGMNCSVGGDVVAQKVLPLDAVQNRPRKQMVPLEKISTLAYLPADGRSRTLSSLFANEDENAKVWKLQFDCFFFISVPQARGEHSRGPRWLTKLKQPVVRGNYTKLQITLHSVTIA